ncbi:hypothetical protein SAMN05216359_11385 [Roseateles sp. YR242]|uniref:hypothetical protein n=1 Tax=Roseateles sp. YR242 TaxID=1855305 RepID=UPI0008CC228A|nr:hypothetical protein [Roseateles sp. YR242]SEL66873.1 hypothetical protein SAMN05216359_11385 [Roseateles sp. YR242]
MKTSFALSSTVATALLLAAGLVCAEPSVQGNNTKPAPAATKASAKKAPAKPAGPAPLPEASAEQLAAAQQAYLGHYDCEFKQSVEITANAKHAGYIDVAFLKQVFTMKPVLSSTGALRLEDVAGRTLMVQIANKSMLLDTNAGRRMVDECIHPQQRAAIEAARAASAVPVSSLGIAPAAH